MACIQLRKRTLVHRAALALPAYSAVCIATVLVGVKAEPVEILEQRLLVLASRSLPIVILDAQHDGPVERARKTPHEDRVHHVAEMQIAGRRRREARARVRGQAGREIEEHAEIVRSVSVQVMGVPPARGSACRLLLVSTP